MNTTVRRSAVVVLLVFSVACGSSGPTSPTETNQFSAPQPPTPPPTQILPPLEGPSRIFIFDAELTYRLRSGNPNVWSVNPREYTRESRFVLYDNGAFALQYPSLGDGAYRGQYRDEGGALMFLFGERRSIFDLRVNATGTFKGDSLTIQYEVGMHHADFEDAVYVLMR